jgi:Tfp pilus assembly protein PilO
MNAMGAWKLRIPARVVIVVGAVCLALVIPAFLHFRLEQQRRQEQVVREREARLESVQKEAEAQRVRLEQRAAALRDAKRVRQLYDELDQLMHASERLSNWGSDLRAPQAKGNQ